MFSTFVHKDYFLALSQVQREVISNGPVSCILKFSRSDVDFVNAHKNYHCALCVAVKLQHQPSWMDIINVTIVTIAKRQCKRQCR